MRKEKVAVIGLGYVGLPLAMAFAKAGLLVHGFDTNYKRRNKVRIGDDYINGNNELLKEVVDKEQLYIPAEFEGVVPDCDAVFICVPTPLTKNREPDIAYVENSAGFAERIVKTGGLVVLESTSYPGTTEEVVLPLLQKRGKLLGKDFHLAFSPERVDPGNKKWNLWNTPKVVGGVTDKCRKRAMKYYKRIVKTVIPASSTRVAEMEKLYENAFRYVNIAFANEMADLCGKMGLDIWEVIRLAATKPYGFMPFTPGPGVGGHCIPIDPLYLTWKAREYDFRARLIEEADEINSLRPYQTAGAVISLLNKHGKTPVNSKVLVLGVAYKPDSSDWRVSPAIKVMELLEGQGVSVEWLDYHIKPEELKYKRKSLGLCLYDCIVICTNNKRFDCKKLFKDANLVLDTCNATEGIESENIYHL